MSRLLSWFSSCLSAVLLLALPAHGGPKHWAFESVALPAVPVGSAHPVDAFVTAGLVREGLALSPEADPVTLIRRLTFDLTGLPPEPEEVAAFVQDHSPAAWSALIDRLLASPQYGERWGRHWLDVARFSESQGFEYDRLRDHAWHYRDYVIRSFNDDKPYDRFMGEQIAGDVMEPVSPDGIVATSLLVCGPWDQASNIQANATQKAIAREDELEDLIGVVGQSFLGLTLNCVRCHDHKSDPIRHEEYYRLKSVFQGVRHGERAIDEKGTLSYAGKREQPAPTRLLKRGDPASPDKVVSPAAIAAIAVPDPEFALPPDAPEAERRRKFAAWLTDPRNPLPARVMVNRLWQQHFGQGLVATPNDFGAGGARPTHPELLDWLAAKFIDSGWSVKAVHRLILTSGTWRQASEMVPPAAQKDADNRWLWRFAPRRLEAEAVRDAMLKVSGRLNPQMGGPGFRPFTVTEFNAAFYHLFDSDEPQFNRRTVYRINVNSGKDPLLDAFDCPDPSVKTPRRGSTTTPLQALELMNNAFVQRQAKLLAERASSMASGSLPEAIESAWRLTLSRPPSPTEAAQALAAATKRGLPSVTWALLNSTEFIYLR